MQFLTLAVVLDGVALPIAFIDLKKIGHSSQAERIAWFTELASRFDFTGMTLLADREYIGLEWFEALRMTFDLNYIVRLKKGSYHDQVNATGPEKTQAEMVAKMKRCRKCERVSKCILIGSVAWYYIIVRNPKAGHPDEDDFVFLLGCDGVLM